MYGLYVLVVMVISWFFDRTQQSTDINRIDEKRKNHNRWPWLVYLPQSIVTSLTSICKSLKIMFTMSTVTPSNYIESVEIFKNYKFNDNINRALINGMSSNFSNFFFKILYFYWLFSLFVRLESKIVSQPTLMSWIETFFMTLSSVLAVINEKQAISDHPGLISNFW